MRFICCDILKRAIEKEFIKIAPDDTYYFKSIVPVPDYCPWCGKWLANDLDNLDKINLKWKEHRKLRQEKRSEL